MLRRSILILWLASGALLAATADTSGAVRAIDAIALTVSDLDRSVDFYTGVLTFEKESDTEVAGDVWERLYGVFGMRARIARLRLGSEHLELIQFLAPEGRSFPPDTRGNDRWFQHVALIVSDMDRAYQRLRTARIRHASSGPQRLPEWNVNAAGIQAFYFHDPDGHFLEILSFPEGKGNPKWHTGGERLFLGIDHSAIVVSDTAASLAFYRDTLGMRVTGESENYGTEQEHLNNVFGARLHITSLRANDGPGIELLEYVAPRDGRPFPNDTKVNDLIHWHTRLVANDAAVFASRLRTERGTWISPGIVDLPANSTARKSFLIRDPDGHAVQIVQP